MEINFIDDKLENFIGTLEKPTVAKLLRALDLLKQFGGQLRMPHSKKVSNRLFELRVHGQQEVRIFYALHKGAAILLHGFIKKSEQIPTRELALAYRKINALDKI